MSDLDKYARKDPITLSWYDDFNKKTQREINYLIGLMNLGEPAEYADFPAFLRTVGDRIVTGKALVRQALKVLEGEV